MQVLDDTLVKTARLKYNDNFIVCDYEIVALTSVNMMIKLHRQCLNLAIFGVTKM